MNGKVQYAFRRPRFPIVCAVGDELISAGSSTVFQRQIDRFDVQAGKTLDIVDARGEGWAFHVDLGIVSPLTLKKRWTKAAVIRLFNESDNARRIGAVYSEAFIPRRSLARIISDVALLVANAKPNKLLQRTGARNARPAAERAR